MSIEGYCQYNETGAVEKAKDVRPVAVRIKFRDLEYFVTGRACDVIPSIDSFYKHVAPSHPTKRMTSQ